MGTNFYSALFLNSYSGLESPISSNGSLQLVNEPLMATGTENKREQHVQPNNKFFKDI